MRKQTRKGFYRRVRILLRSKLNGSIELEAINTLAAPVFTYSKVNWQMNEVRKIDTKARKLLTMEQMNHPKQTWRESTSQVETCLENKRNPSKKFAKERKKAFEKMKQN